MADNPKVQKVQPQGADYSVLWSNVNQPSKIPEGGSSDGHVDQVAEVVRQNGGRLSHATSTNHTDMDIWKEFDSGSFYHTRPQEAVKTALGMRHGQDVFMFDMETLGTFKPRKSDALQWFHPTEFAVTHATVGADGALAHGSKSMSMVIKPNDDVFGHLQNLIGKVKNAGTFSPNLTSDERRTLNDLILYSADNPTNIFDTITGADGRKITQLKRQLRTKQALDNTIFTSSHVSRMEKGLKNLMTYGTSFDDAVSHINDFFSGHSNFMIGGYNTSNFDVPAMLDYLSTQTAKNKSNSVVTKALGRLSNTIKTSPNLDVLSLAHTFFKNSYYTFGKNTKLEDVASIFGLNKGTSHMGIDDAKTTIDVFNKMLGLGMGKKLKNGKSLGLWNDTPVKLGDKFLSISGIRYNGDENPFDTIYRRNKDGIFELAHATHGGAPLYNNTQYSVFGLYNNLNLGGKNHYGVMLQNHDDGLFHFIARENLGDLQNVFQQNMKSFDGLLGAHGLGQSIALDDRALRRYNKLFSSDGTLLKRFMSGLDVLNKGGSDRDILSAMTLKRNDGTLIHATDEQLRDLKTMKGRLSKESDYINEFIKRVDADSALAGKDGYSARVSAYRGFKNLMDQRFGQNLAPRQLPSTQPVLPVRIGEDVVHISMSHPERTKQSIRNIINRGHGSSARGLVKQARFTDLINQLKAAGALTPYQADEHRRIIEGLDKDDVAFHNIIDSLTERLHQTTNARSYLMNAETTHGVVGSRYVAMKKAWGTESSNLMNEAINQAKAFSKHTFGGAGEINVIGGTGFEDALTIHDKAVQEIIGLTGVNPQRVGVPTSAKATLSNLAKAYSHGDVSAALLYDKNKKGLVLALVNKEYAQQVFGMAPNKIIEDSRVASVKIPMINKEGSVVLGTTARTARLKAVQGVNGGYSFLSGFDEVVTQLMKMAPTARDLMEKGKALDAQGWMNSKVRETLQNLSMNNRHVDLRDTSKVLDSVESKAAMYLRRGYLDVSAFAEQWYRSEYVSRETRIYDKASWNAWDDRRNKRANSLADRASKSYESFVEQLNPEERQAFQFGIDGWLEQNYGIKTSMHSIKDTAVSQYLRSTTDARSLTPFGYYNPMARENLFKSVNYYPLDADHVRSQLTAAGKDVSSYMERRFVTDEATGALGGETNYLNMRAAHISSKTIADRVSALQKMSETDLANLDISPDDLKGAGRLSTHEGTFLLRESVSNAFSITRRQNIQLSNTSSLHEDIQQYIKDVHGEFDPSKSYELSGNKRLSDLVGRKNGKITVGQLVREGQDPKAQDYYDGWNNDVYVKGWDADRRALVIQKREGVSNGTKFISDAGDRVTSVIVKDKVADYLMGQGVDVGLEPVNVKRRQFGTELYKAVNLAIDEIHRQEKITPGKIALLETLQGHVDEAFGTAGRTRLRNGKLIIDHMVGADGSSLSVESLNNFATKVNNLLGKNLIGSDQAQIGLARANVHDWEDSRGLIEGDRQGLVRYGLKEIDMIQARLDRHAASGIIGKEASVIGWVRDHVSTIGHNQGQMSQDIAHGYMRSAATAAGLSGPAKGDVIIRTRGDAFSYMSQDGLVTDKSGKQFAVMRNGVTEISHNAFSALPHTTMQGERFTIGDYAKTVLNMSGVDLQVMGKDGTEQGSFKDLLHGNRGTALYELPTQVAGKDHVRFIDTDLARVGDMPVMTNLHKAQTSVWRASQEYMRLKNHPDENINKVKAKKKLEESVLHYEDTIARTISSSRDSSLAKTFMSAQMNMSARFRIQGINPFLTKKAGYEESTLYVSRARMAEMIQGGEENVASALGMNVSRMRAEHARAGGQDFAGHLKSTVLDKIEENGLYGFVNRYPTINEDTIQVMKVAVDKTLAETDRSGYMTVGTSVRLKADYDGDFLSSVLAHYGAGNAGQIHSELGLVHRADQKEMNGFAEKIQKDLESTASKRGISVGDLWKDSQFRQEFGADIRSRTSALDNMESGFARLGKEHIGVIDNTRYKLLNMAEATYDALHSAGRIDEEAVLTGRAKVQEFGRAFSQNLISSKKFSIDEIMKQYSAQDFSQGDLEDVAQRALHERLNALEEMKAAVKTPDADGIARIKRANEVLQVFEENRGDTQRFGLDEMLSEIQKLYRLNGNNKKWLDSRSMKFGVSEGTSMTTVGDLMRGGLEGEQVIATPHIKNVMNILEQDTATVHMAEGIRQASKQHQASVISRFDSMQGRPISNLDMATEATKRTADEMLSGATVAEKVQSKFTDVMKNTVKKGAGGAVGFGMIAIGLAELGDAWATGSLNRRKRGGPTPEQTSQKDNPNYDTGSPQQLKSIPGVTQPQPTARVMQNNGEYMNIRINAKSASNMSHDQVAAIVQNEINASMGTQVSMNMNVNDNTQNIDKQWLQGVVANAVSTGYAR